MSAETISGRVIEILNSHDIPYMVVDSLSTNYHSAVRSTKDADIVVQSNLGDTARIIANEYADLFLDPQLGFEGVTLTKKIILRAKSEHFIVELFGLSEDAHDQVRFSRR